MRWRLQEARDQAKRAQGEQRAFQQEIDKLRDELAESASKLEAKRAKKRRWKELHGEQQVEVARIGDVLRDKQFAVEKAVLRFAAVDARIKAGEIFQEQPRELTCTGGAEGSDVVHELEQALATKQQERQNLQEALQSHKAVRPSLQRNVN